MREMNLMGLAMVGCTQLDFTSYRVCLLTLAADLSNRNSCVDLPRGWSNL